MPTGTIITAYPTKGITDRTLNNIMCAYYDYCVTIPEITDFFDNIVKVGDGLVTSIDFKKESTKITLNYSGSTSSPKLQWNLHSNSTTSANTANNAYNTDIGISHVTGINGTTAIFLDSINLSASVMFNTFEEHTFLAMASGTTSYSIYTAVTAGNTPIGCANPFNGNNLGTGGDYIAQPYYYKGINTKDIYTFDGGGEPTIPGTKFKFGGGEFVRLCKNFALRIK